MVLILYGWYHAIRYVYIFSHFGIYPSRWWVAAHGTQHMTIPVSDKLLQQAAENLNKIRLTLRYFNGVIRSKVDQNQSSQHVENLKYLNRYLLSKLVDFDEEVSYFCSRSSCHHV